MRKARTVVATATVSLALFAAGTALSTWWSAAVLGQVDRTLGGALSQSLSGELGGLGLGAGGSSGQVGAAEHQVSMATGEQASSMAARLRVLSAGASGITALLLGCGLALTPRSRRRRALARVGRWAAWAGGLALASWLVPAVVAGLWGHGGVHDAAHTVAAADAPGRIVATAVLVAGAALLVATHLPGRRAADEDGAVGDEGDPRAAAVGAEVGAGA